MVQRVGLLPKLVLETDPAFPFQLIPVPPDPSRIVLPAVVPADFGRRPTFRVVVAVVRQTQLQDHAHPTRRALGLPNLSAVKDAHIVRLGVVGWVGGNLVHSGARGVKDNGLLLLVLRRG